MGKGRETESHRSGLESAVKVGSPSRSSARRAADATPAGALLTLRHAYGAWLSLGGPSHGLARASGGLLAAPSLRRVSQGLGEKERWGREGGARAITDKLRIITFRFIRYSEHELGAGWKHCAAPHRRGVTAWRTSNRPYPVRQEHNTYTYT